MRVLLGALASLLLLGACANEGGGASGGQPRVVASFYPLAFVVEEVSADLAELQNLTPPGAEPHDLELTAGQVRALAEADLVVYIGQGFQPAVEDALADVEAAQIEALSQQPDLLEGHEEGGRDDAAEEEGHDEEGAADPHVWLDPERMAFIADEVAQALSRIDGDKADAYRANADELKRRLEGLDREFEEGLSSCERSTIVTSHEAFGYLAAAYGLEEIGIAGIDPETEPSPGRLAELAEYVRDNDVTTIFFEVLVSPDTAETLAQEVGVETARLDPLEGPPVEGDYFTSMRANLEVLRDGLTCT